MVQERQQSALELLRGMGDPSSNSAARHDKFCRLFWTELNYHRVNQPLSRKGWSDTAANALVDEPLLFAGGGQDNAFHVIYSRLASDRLLLGAERPVVSRLLRDHPYTLFVFSNAKQDRWHFLNVKYDKETAKRRLFRRITIGPEERLRTASERLALLDLELIGLDLFGLSPLSIQERHDEAFDVEAVTRQFFQEYKDIFNIIQDDLAGQTKDKPWAHDYALQFLNRCMFLYFVQRKGWLGKDTEFLRLFWESYKNSGQAKDLFFDRWLKVLFFEAFNNSFHGGHRHFPDEIKEALALAPFLNGGLFAQNEVDQKYSFTIPDGKFQQVFNFLERYNFTIAEDSPLDKEVAVDPEMIGKVYESLVNVSTEADERGEAGIFYTPRTEIDLMCRLALVDFLSNHLGQKNKNLLYETIFALETDEKTSADRGLAEANLWPVLDSCLREITILDPACGSGSFLVGMLYILDELQERANQHLARKEKAYERKKRIIGQNLYAVDVMNWACHVAELRLWLALTVDADFTPQELHVRKEPLLPHFTFKIRCGDSLVQEVGSINLGYIRGSQSISPALKDRIARLKSEKMKFYNNDPARKFRTPQQAMEEELRIFRAILDMRHHDIQEEIKIIRHKIEGPSERQIRLDGHVEERTHQLELQAVEWQKKIESLENDLDRINQARSALKTIKDVPFVWDIAFVEIFEAGKTGFDIVIGNPPYVRQENISDPHMSREDVTAENKKEYKTKLARSVYQAFPSFFGYKSSTDTAGHKLDAKSDLYIYFYFHGLSLLNDKGSFCFITSNSWLDVGYGADLQEFLLKHCHVKMVIDNQTKRSFASADVNTVIALFSSPSEGTEWGLKQTARFVMFKVPFEHILSSVIFEEIESEKGRKNTQEYRLHPIPQKELLLEGWEWPEDTTEDTKNRFGVALKGSAYGGNKWGGKYLRAPEVYWTILQRGKDKLVRLGDIAQVRFGIKTGANEFFYLDEEKIAHWQIEPRFLHSVIVSPRECASIMVEPEKLKYKAFLCHLPKAKLRGTKVLRYIEWGESQNYHRRASCASRNLWYDLGIRTSATILWPMIHNDRPGVYLNQEGVLVDHNLFEVVTDSTLGIWASLFWIGQIIFRELYGRSNLGQGALKTEGSDIKKLAVINPQLFSPDHLAQIERSVEKISKRMVESVRAEAGIIDHDSDPSPLQDRILLDNIFFDIIGLTLQERKEVYVVACELIKKRLGKAESLKRKGGNYGPVDCR